MYYEIYITHLFLHQYYKCKQKSEFFNSLDFPYAVKIETYGPGEILFSDAYCIVHNWDI